MRLNLRDGTRFTVFSVVLIASAVRYPAAGADQTPILIRHAALVLTMDTGIGQGSLGMLTGADVLVVGDTIAAVGRQLSRQGAEVVDATGKIVMPGFVDAHTHLWQSLIRGCGADADVNGWLAACVP